MEIITNWNQIVNTIWNQHGPKKRPRGYLEALDYQEWRNFSNVIEKAKESCRTSGYDSEYHFVDVNKMVPIGSGSRRSIEDIRLTRYACYLIVQNGDPSK